MPPVSPRPGQLPLPLSRDDSSAAADWVADASNAEAMAWLAQPGDWPARRLALFGPEGVGKSHLLRVVAAGQGWRVLRGAALDEAAALDPAPGTALDDAEAADETALFHLINRSAEAGVPLLLAARLPPARWATRLPDLASRLRATQSAGIGAPSDALLAALMAKHLADRQLRVDPGVQAFLLARLKREAAAVAGAIAALDDAALAEHAPITRPFARAVLGSLLAGGGADTEDDDAMTPVSDASPEPPRLV